MSLCQHAACIRQLLSDTEFIWNSDVGSMVMVVMVMIVVVMVVKVVMLMVDMVTW